MPFVVRAQRVAADRRAAVRRDVKKTVKPEFLENNQKFSLRLQVPEPCWGGRVGEGADEMAALQQSIRRIMLSTRDLSLMQLSPCCTGERRDGPTHNGNRQR
jgi:hypothetical protein